VFPVALAANAIETVAAPLEQELIEVEIVNVTSQSIVLEVNVDSLIPLDV